MHLHLLGNLQAQAVKTQWLLFVELHQFHNLYNAQVKDGGGFCWCDTNPTTNKIINYYCTYGEAKNLSDCRPLCDTRLNVSVADCTDPNPCSFSTEVHFDTASIGNFSERFILALCSSSSAVRETKCLCIINWSIYFFHLYL